MGHSSKSVAAALDFSSRLTSPPPSAEVTRPLLLPLLLLLSLLLLLLLLLLRLLLLLLLMLLLLQLLPVALPSPSPSLALVLLVLAALPSSSLRSLLLLALLLLALLLLLRLLRQLVLQLVLQLSLSAPPSLSCRSRRRRFLGAITLPFPRTKAFSSQAHRPSESNVHHPCLSPRLPLLHTFLIPPLSSLFLPPPQRPERKQQRPLTGAAIPRTLDK